MSVINVEHISKLYGDKMILEDLSCSVDEGDKIGIIGINGTGKSTLLRIIAGEEEAVQKMTVFSKKFAALLLPGNLWAACIRNSEKNRNLKIPIFWKSHHSALSAM